MSETDDCLTKLHRLCDEDRGRITKRSRKIELMNNGVEYYFVEVTRENDGQFGIQAFGDEALELFKESTSIIQTQVLVDMVSSLYG
ncbi:MAG: hypothetical protein WB511_07035 [Nitrososphaeraceae archaeon]|jgi:hypothetical protein